MLQQLRETIASVISNAKAYDVPGLCRRLGLADGTEEEAFKSKFRYAHKRVVELNVEAAIKCARELATEDDDYSLVELLAKVDELSDPVITTITRRRLMGLFKNKPLATEIKEIEFIRAIWPIAQMPAPIQGGGYTLEDDIYRHTIENDDLSQDELLEHLGLLTCSRAQLSKFLEAVTSPEFQEEEVQSQFASKINELLLKDGYTLQQIGVISGSPHYKVQKCSSGAPADQEITKSLAAFEPDQIQPRWEAALTSRSTDPERAITLARTLLEDVCKWILHEAGEMWAEHDDLPALYKKLAKVLKLAPDDHTEQIFKQILGSCQSIVESLGSLRNKLGDAHSIGPKRVKPHARHAELAVNLAGAMATFLISTWNERQKKM